MLAAATVWLAAAGWPRAQSAPKAPPCAIETTERVVAVGDVHGAYDRFTAILHEAGLIDDRQRWIGGRARLVQTGDLLDRGPDSRKALDLVRRLEGEAEKAGGRVHALLGNHEVMRMMGDLRYTSDGEYAAFRSRDADALRERYYETALAANAAQARSARLPFDERAYRQTFLDATPLGFVEMRTAFAPQGEYGRWLLEHAAMVKINGVLFLHGGTSPAVAALGCAAINAGIRSELQAIARADPKASKRLVASDDGPLWYRGLIEGGPAVTSAELDTMLRDLGARAIVVGHTSSPDGKIRSLFGGRVFQIDTGMLGGPFFEGGRPSALEMIGPAFTAIYEGSREVLKDVKGMEEVTLFGSARR
jgi:hypothetical protein